MNGIGVDFGYGEMLGWQSRLGTESLESDS